MFCSFLNTEIDLFFSGFCSEGDWAAWQVPGICEWLFPKSYTFPQGYDHKITLKLLRWINMLSKKFLSYRLLRRLLRSFATRVLLEAQVQNCLPLSVTIFLRKEEVKNWVMKQLKKLLKRQYINPCVPYTSINMMHVVLRLRFLLFHLQVVKLLAYISDKDLFAEFYR